MRLSKRIYAIADQIGSGETVADIGTDHGYVPMLLIKNGISPHVIMTDISSGSLSKARITFEIAGLMDKVSDADFRVGNGLMPLSYGETDSVIIAGLGGHTICDILVHDEIKSKSFKKLVLQPRKHSGSLRYLLYTHGWDIESEKLAEEGKFACEIITAVPAAVRSRKALYPEEDIRWKYPLSMVHSDPGLSLKRIRWKMGSIREQTDNLRDSDEDHSSLLKRLENDLGYLTELDETAVRLLNKSQA